jgi:hypothetical protein
VLSAVRQEATVGAHTLNEYLLVSSFPPRLAFWNLMLKNPD